MRRPTPRSSTQAVAAATGPGDTLGVSPNTLMVLLCIAGVGCCVAMAMPQVHIALLRGLGYGRRAALRCSPP
jgi:hypothetical protein